jgi:hypothetical protein
VASMQQHEVTIVSIINGALVLSIVFNAVGIQVQNAVTRSTFAGDTGLEVNRAPDETFRLFETYETGIDAKEIRQRLHWLAIFLKQDPDFNGFIVSYAGQPACSGEAIKRAKIARQFLITNEGVKSRQLKIVDAGYRSNWVVELWYGPVRAKGKPSSSSAIDRSIVKITKGCSDIISLR